MQTVALVPTASGQGYWMINADGGVFTFGDAQFYGSLPQRRPGVQNVVAAIRVGNTKYCMLESSGRTSCFAAGSIYEDSQPVTYGLHSDPATTMIPSGDAQGWWVVSRKGKVSAYGSAVGAGEVAQQPYGPIMGGAGWGNNTYRLVGADGGVFTFGLSYQGNVSVSGHLSSRSAQQIARVMLPQGNWGTVAEWNALNDLWGRLESNWRWNAYNPLPCAGGGNAYGIPQSCPGNKMATAGPDWENNAWTQIMWGFSYISDRYGNPIHAREVRLDRRGY